jgi:hypothetical protein
LFRETTVPSLILSTYAREISRGFVRAVIGPALTKVVEDNLVVSNQTVCRWSIGRCSSAALTHAHSCLFACIK